MLAGGSITNSQNNIQNISQFQFNIPDGYVLDNDSDNVDNDIFWTIPADSLGLDMSNLIAQASSGQVPDGATIYNETARHYYDTNNESNTLSIIIDHPYQGKGFSEDELELNATINGVQGELSESYSGEAMFKYVKNHCEITITAPTQDIINNVIVNS